MLHSSKLSTFFNSPESPQQAGFRGETRIASRQRMQKELIRERSMFAHDKDLHSVMKPQELMKLKPL